MSSEREIQEIYITALRARKLENARWLLANGAKRVVGQSDPDRQLQRERAAVTDFFNGEPGTADREILLLGDGWHRRNIVELFAEFTTPCPAMVELSKSTRSPCGQHLVHNIPHSVSRKSLDLLYEKRLLADDARTRSPLRRARTSCNGSTHIRGLRRTYQQGDSAHWSPRSTTTIAWLYMEKLVDPEELFQGTVGRSNTTGIRTLIQCGLPGSQNLLDSMRPTLKEHVLKIIEEKKTAAAKSR